MKITLISILLFGLFFSCKKADLRSLKVEEIPSKKTYLSAPRELYRSGENISKYWVNGYRDPDNPDIYYEGGWVYEVSSPSRWVIKEREKMKYLGENILQEKLLKLKKLEEYEEILAKERSILEQNLQKYKEFSNRELKLKEYKEKISSLEKKNKELNALISHLRKTIKEEEEKNKLILRGGEK